MSAEMKYELGGIHPSNPGLRRVVAARSFGEGATRVERGHVGGWVSGKHNLSHEGNAWVSGNALVRGHEHQASGTRTT